MHNTVTPRLVERVKDLASQGCETPEISKLTGISWAIVRQIRQGRYDTGPLRRRFGDAALEQDNTSSTEENEEPVILWCKRCNCHVYLPCQLCLAKSYQRSMLTNAARRQSAELPADVDEQTRNRLRKTVAEIGLSLRIVHSLQDVGIHNVNDLLHTTAEELLSIPFVGDIGLQRIYRALAKLGFHRKPTDEDSAAKP